MLPEKIPQIQDKCPISLTGAAVYTPSSQATPILPQPVKLLLHLLEVQKEIVELAVRELHGERLLLALSSTSRQLIPPRQGFVEPTPHHGADTPIATRDTRHHAY
jgi:hypothetical protein